MNISQSAPPNYGRRKVVDRLMRLMLLVTVLLAVIPLLLILGHVLVRGAGALNVAFFTETYRPPLLPGETDESLSRLLLADEDEIEDADMLRTAPMDKFVARGGVLHGIVGTLLITSTALLIATPIGIMAGIFVSEYRESRFATVVRFACDVLSGAPSIIVGVTAYLIIVRHITSFSGLAGSIALAFLMVPIATRTTEEVLKLVPWEIREAALALGAPSWYTTLVVVIPAALPGIITGLMLAFARGAGETAPLLLTVSTSNELSFNLLEPIATLPLITYQYASSQFPSENVQAWGTAFVLTMIVLLVNITVRLITWRTRGGR